MKKMLLKNYYIMLKTKDLIIIFFNILYSRFKKPPFVHSTDITLDKIVSDKCSVSRFGDGEFALMYGKGLLFQPYSKELSIRLKEILKSHRENHIVCVPNVFNSVEWCNEKSNRYWIKYLNINRSKIYKMLNMKKEYYDTQVTRLYMDHKDKSRAEERFEKFKILWNNREIVIVEGEQSRLGIGNDLFENAASIKRILCPAINAYSKYEEIIKEIKRQNKDKLILIALGPTATILAYDLSLAEYQAIDIGHIDIEYEWFLQKAEEKIPVKNKYIGEIPNGNLVDDITDARYQKEIIKKVV